MTLAQNQPNGQPFSTMHNALDLQGGLPPLDGAPPISTSTTPHPTAAPFLEDTTTASVISQSITSGHLSPYPFLVGAKSLQSPSAEFALTATYSQERRLVHLIRTLTPLPTFLTLRNRDIIATRSQSGVGPTRISSNMAVFHRSPHHLLWYLTTRAFAPLWVALSA